MSKVDGAATSSTSSTSTDGRQDAPPAGGLLGRFGRVVQRLSSAKEGGAYQGAFSYAAEWHAFGIGVAVGAQGDPTLRTAFVAYALGRGGARKQWGDAAHVKDVTEEPAYALAGLVVGGSLRGGQLTLGALGGIVPA